MPYFGIYPTDPIELGAQARPILAKLHGRSDVVVRLVTDRSGFKKDRVDDFTKKRTNGGHFNAATIMLTLDLDKLITKGKLAPISLSSIEDFRQYPLIAGVGAHESAHAKHSLWHNSPSNPFPETIPNPGFDPEDAENTGPEFFPVRESHERGQGKLVELAKVLEEPRIERLGMAEFSKTWKKALEFSAGHLTLQAVGEMDAEGQDALDSAVRLMILVGGRQIAGTLGGTKGSKAAVKKVMDSAQKIIEKALSEDPDAEPFQQIMSIISRAVIDSDDFNATTKLEHARQILAIVHPEALQDPDSGKPDSDGGEDGGEEDGESGGAAMPGAGGSAAGSKGSKPGDDEESEGTGGSEGDQDSEGDPEGQDGGAEGSSDGEEPEDGKSEEEREAEKRAQREAMAEMLGDLVGEIQEAVEALGREEMKDVELAANQRNDNKANDWGGHGATKFKNPRAPQTRKMVEPEAADRELYRRAVAFFERQIAPTVTTEESGQWLPIGGARLNVRSYVRDNLAGHVGNQRGDWDRVSETVKPAPPVKLAVMLDGSGSMGPWARRSAGIAWAAANAAADLPESRTVSVVYGDAAQVTQEPGHAAPRQIAVSNTDGGMEDFIGAAAMVEEALWLGDDVEEGEPSNVYIVIVSDLVYGGTANEYGTDPAKPGRYENQLSGFGRIAKEWVAKGYQILVIGTGELQREAKRNSSYMEYWTRIQEYLKPLGDGVTLVNSEEDLFR